ncbi:unnamed protein product [Sphenostylis stenocarpa]|uniref:Ubiquitin-like protease family profile domain-containing protein n=1 Tax=Sphenostylis stenocarpa TaxID=92480 RepID=A0AA86VFW5_9FABA|nr:unnamed protein product [Sphenostylis stenocarpa]
MTRRTRSSSSSTKKFEVFEFNDEDQSIEKASKRILRKFENPSRSRSSLITKYDFLQSFTSGSNSKPVSIEAADHIDLDDYELEEEEEVTKCSAEEVANQPIELVDGENDDDRGHDEGDHLEDFDNPCAIDTRPQLSANKDISGYNGLGESDIDSKNLSLEVASDDTSQTSSSCTSTSNPAEDEVNFGDQLVEHGDSAAFKINDIEKVVDVIPDFIQCEDLYSTCSQLTFTCNSLKLKGSTINGTRETFKIEWTTEDIIKIESCWFGNIETALINLLLKSKDYTKAGTTNQNPGVTTFNNYVINSCANHVIIQATAEEAIKLLDTRYTDIWSTFFDIDADNNGNISALGKHYFFSQQRYFPNFDETFDEVIYPKGEPDAVSISKRDVELLQPQTFINDTIIDFYIKYLKNKLPTDEQDRFHFFNSFFFRKLADLDKDPSSACDGRAAFQRVRKWTRKVNLFEKDFILIPINYSNWFPPPEASLKRSHIQKLIYDIFENNSFLARPTDCLDKGLPTEDPAIIVQTKVEKDSLRDCCYPDLWCVKNPVNSSSQLETVDIQYPTASPRKVSSFLGGPALVSKDLHVISRSDCLQMSACGQRGFLAPLEENEKSGEETALSIEREKSQLVYDFPSTSYVSKDHGASESSQHGFSVNFVEAFEIHSHPRTTTSLSWFPLNTSTHEDQLLKKIDEPNISDKTYVEYLSTSGEELTDYVVPDSPLPTNADVSFVKSHSSFLEYMNPLITRQMLDFTQKTLANDTLVNKEKPLAFESDVPDVKRSKLMDAYFSDYPGANDGHDADVSVKSPSSFREYMNSVTHQMLDLTQKTSLGEDTLVSDKDDPVAFESDEPDAKRPKLMNEGGPSRRFTRSMIKEACV